MKTQNLASLAFILFLSIGCLFAQENKQVIKPVKFNLNEDGSHYLHFTALNQIWLRNTSVNPGSTLYGNKVDQISDIGIRRLRFQVIAQISEKVFFYVQFGQNNFSFLQPRYTGSFFHDAITEYSVADKKLSIGAGLTGWSGLSRYASPSIGSLLSLDTPLYQQATNGITDQFLRNLSVYTKGQIWKVDYRLIASKPMAVQNSTAPIGAINKYNSEFSPEPAHFQYQGYFKLQLKDHESNLTPYNTGAYLGKKNILAIGAGFIQQTDALWKLNDQGDTTRNQMLLLSVDVFYDAPINQSKTMALTLYCAFSHYDYGANYLRNIGVMNLVNGVNANGTVNGSGNALPLIGTGNTLYGQAGFLFGKNIINEGGKLQPFVAAQYSTYQALSEPMFMMEGGLNWFLHGTHGSKLSLNYQSRPIFESNVGSKPVETMRKGMAQMQFQIAF